MSSKKFLAGVVVGMTMVAAVAATLGDALRVTDCEAFSDADALAELSKSVRLINATLCYINRR